MIYIKKYIHNEGLDIISNASIKDVGQLKKLSY